MSCVSFSPYIIMTEDQVVEFLPSSQTNSVQVTPHNIIWRKHFLLAKLSLQIDYLSGYKHFVVKNRNMAKQNQQSVSGRFPKKKLKKFSIFA